MLLAPYVFDNSGNHEPPKVSWTAIWCVLRHNMFNCWFSTMITAIGFNLSNCISWSQACGNGLFVNKLYYQSYLTKRLFATFDKVDVIAFKIFHRWNFPFLVTAMPIDIHVLQR